MTLFDLWYRCLRSSWALQRRNIWQERGCILLRYYSLWGIMFF